MLKLVEDRKRLSLKISVEKTQEGKKEGMKKTTYNVEKLPREQKSVVSVCDVIKSELEYAEKIEFKVIDSVKNVEKNFTLEDFKNDNDGLTRREFMSDVLELVIENHTLNTGREIAYQDEDGKQKTKIEKLPLFKKITMTI